MRMERFGSFRVIRIMQSGAAGAWTPRVRHQRVETPSTAPEIPEEPAILVLALSGFNARGATRGMGVRGFRVTAFPKNSDAGEADNRRMRSARPLPDHGAQATGSIARLGTAGQRASYER
jgi:hypothetical protein